MVVHCQEFEVFGAVHFNPLAPKATIWFLKMKVIS